MTFEAQVVLRREDPDELADDFRAVVDFLAKRQANKTQRVQRAGTSAAPRSTGHLELVKR